jgi:hypothetical protein
MPFHKINMNKDQKLLAEAYEDVQASQNRINNTLDSTVDLEAIADFLNQNQVWSGSPVRGSGGWYVHNSEVTNDDAEGGYSGISVKMVPGDEGLTAHCKSSGPAVFPWPVRAQDVERYMQSKNSNL